MIDWAQKLVCRDGTKATLLARDGWQEKVGDTRRRVLRSDRGSNPNEGTVVLCDENGRCNPDRESGWDALQAA